MASLPQQYHGRGAQNSVRITPSHSQPSKSQNDSNIAQSSQFRKTKIKLRHDEAISKPL